MYGFARGSICLDVFALIGDLVVSIAVLLFGCFAGFVFMVGLYLSCFTVNKVGCCAFVVWFLLMVRLYFVCTEWCGFEFEGVFNFEGLCCR